MTTPAAQTPIVFSSKSECPWARAVRRVLDQHGLAYEERPIDRNPTHLEQLRRETGQQEQPTLKIGEDWLVDTDAEGVARRVGLPEPEAVRISA